MNTVSAVKKSLKDTTLRINDDDVIAKLTELKGPAFVEYRKRWERTYIDEEPPAFPLHIDFETVYGCNLRCVQCHLQLNHSDAKSFMEFKQELPIHLYKKVVDEGMENGMCAVTVNNIGEPLLRDDIFEFISYARDKGVLDIWMSTNGVLMDKEKARKLIESGLTRLNISLDAHTAETYHRVRGKDFLDRIKTNIHNLMELKREMGSFLPQVKVSFCVLRLNEDELDDFVEYWSDKVDNVAIQQYWEANEKEKLRGNKKVILEKFRCREPWHRIAINADGTVSPCCLPWRKGFTMGDVHTQTIKEIWTSAKMTRLRGNLRESKYDAEFYKCEECIERKFQ